MKINISNNNISNNFKIYKALITDIDDMLLLEKELDIHILSKKNMLEDFKNNNYKYFVLTDVSKEKNNEKQNNIIGYIAISHVLDTIDILSIVIKKDYQNLGLGSYLLNYIINFAKENKILNILLEVRKSNCAAIKFYEKNNFKNISIRKNYYTNPVEDAFIYMLNIDS